MAKVKSLSSQWISDLYAPSGNSNILVPKALEEGPSSEGDLMKLVDRAIQSQSKLPPDLKIDDRDMKEAPNFLAFCLSTKGLNMKPFARQAYLGIKLFHEYCPDCSPDKKITQSIENCPVDLDSPELAERFQLLRYGVCPKCGKNKLDFLRRKRLYFYEELAACVGQRGGKSAVVSMLSSYLIHKYIKMQRPAEVLGLLPNATLVGTFVALNMQGAMELLWNPFQDALSHSWWYQEYFKLLDYYEDRYGEEIYKRMTTFLQLKHRNLLIYPSGPSKRSLRGRNRLLSAVDEIGWFDNSDDSKLRSAEEVYTALDRSLLTVRSAAKRLVRQGFVNVLPGYAFNISSPSNAFDKITMLIKQHENSRKVFTVHLPTWEFNPTIKRSDLSKEFQADPIKAERDYGANPPKATSPFIENAMQTIDCFDSGKNLIEYTPVYGTMKGVRYKWVELKKAPKNVPYNTVLALDAGQVNNSFAIMIGHSNRLDDKSIVPIIDVVLEIAPEPGIAELDFSKIAEKVLYPLIEIFHVKLVLSDRWQSVKFLHDVARKFGIEVETYSVRYSDFQMVKSYLLSDGIKLPKLEKAPDDAWWDKLDYSTYPRCFENFPVSHLYGQIETVEDQGPKTVGKGDLFTDDLFRALALISAYLLDEDYQSLFQSNEKVEVARPAAIGTAVGLSSGTSIKPFGALTSTRADGLVIGTARGFSNRG